MLVTREESEKGVIPVYTMEVDQKQCVYRISINDDDQNREKQRIIRKDEDDTKDAVKQILLPVILSGFGNMGAGIILDAVQTWPVFLHIPQLIILVPALLGLKGNVEMTLSSRLGTAANMGVLADKEKRKQIVLGSISLAQCQASAIGLLTPLIAIGFGYIRGGYEDMDDHQQLTVMKVLLVIACAVITSGLADLMLSSLMCLICIVSQIVFKINSDNISTPIAASVGDLATMGFLALTSKILYSVFETVPWVSIFPICIWSVITVITGIIARRNDFTKKIVFTGWTPLVLSMIIQNTSGAVMETFIRQFVCMAAFQPVINGFGGNLVAIQSSRIATHLHKTCKKKQLPEDEKNICFLPWNLFFNNGSHGKLALILVLMAGPLQLPFIIIIRFITQRAILTPQFVVTYYICCTLQVFIMLYIGFCFVHILWKFGFNPDNSAIPILTALADLLGSIFLACGFLVLQAINDPNAFTDIATGATTQFITANVTEIMFNATTISP